MSVRTAKNSRSVRTYPSLVAPQNRVDWKVWQTSVFWIIRCHRIQRRPSRGQEFDVARAMRTFLEQMADDAFRSAPRSLRSSSRTPMTPEPPNWS